MLFFKELLLLSALMATILCVVVYAASLFVLMYEHVTKRKEASIKEVATNAAFLYFSTDVMLWFAELYRAL